MGVSIAFDMIIRETGRSKTLECVRHIETDAWIVILINRYRRRGVGDKDDADTLLDFAPMYNF